MMTIMQCDQCRIGHCRPITAPFMTLLGGRMIVVPGVPAMLCDVCGEVEFDDDFTGRLQYLLERLGDRPPRPGPAARPPVTDVPLRWQPGRRSS